MKDGAAQFLDAFFGPGNAAWPDRDFTGPTGRRLEKYLTPLTGDTDIPLILPRRRRIGGATEAYVICWNLGQATWMRATLEAFVAHSYAAFDGRFARLAPNDPVDAAVLNLVGPGTTYVLVAPDEACQSGLWQSLQRMLLALTSCPERAVLGSRPLGRMLAEFQAALAAGNATASAALLDELTAAGGLSALNLSYLRVHRLSRLGRDRELLRLPNLDDVVASGPPPTVRDALLAAWGRTHLDDLVIEDAPSLDAALDRIRRRIDGIGFLVDSRVAGLGVDAQLVAALVALARPDPEVARALVAGADLPAQLRTAMGGLLSGAGTLEAPRPALDTERLTVARPASWTAWARSLVATDPGSLVEDDRWRTWPPPAAEDAQLAAALEEVGDAGADVAWTMVGSFLDADEFGRPAWRAAKAFLVLAGTYDRWAPADLAGIQALIEVFLRGGPAADDYREILDLIGGHAARWASVTNALPSLDMVDVLARLPVADPDARLRFALHALEPLHRHVLRLPVDLRWLAGQLSDELQLSLGWEVAPDSPAEETSVASAPITVLLYSLDEGALRRTEAGVASLAPRSTVHASSGKVGSPQLKMQARSADVVALATRCAKHAATGFIRQHTRPGAIVVEADGAGSASLLRAVVAGMEQRTGGA